MLGDGEAVMAGSRGPRAARIVEVCTRDGLQNVERVVPTRTKLDIIERSIAAGVRRFEVTSFVDPRRVPQMADGEAVVAGLPDRKDVSYIGLCLNEKGVTRAAALRAGGRRGVDEVGCVLVATDALGQRNQGQTVEEGLVAVGRMMRRARAEGMVSQVTIGAAFGCPFEGRVPAGRVVELAVRLAEDGPFEVALADTIGVAVPAQVRDLVGALAEALPRGIGLRMHFHDTRNTGVANVQAAWDAGVSCFDASLGGLGGCPFAPRATGNVATEDLAYLFGRSGVPCGLELAATLAAARWMSETLSLPLPSRVSQAGDFLPTMPTPGAGA